ncbi:MAG TPA: ATP-binding protein [Streptosporangiaceae bacterium]|nr:ATP-binding protein [Streptosporangiaceae bacterium]
MTAVAWGLAAGVLVLAVACVALALRLRRTPARIATAVETAKTEQKELADRAADLQRSNAELEQFAYLASHDLQEPLRKVASFCELLQRRYAGRLDARADQYIEYAVDGAHRMQALINDLLAFSRVGQGEARPALVSSEKALAQARTNLAREIEESAATVEAGHLPLVLAELPLLVAVFQNLLSNAIKFSGSAKPRIVVGAARDGADWRFTVTDHGIGIDSKDAERIFGLFQRLNERSTYPGTGVGLAMCRKIVEYFGGRIWLDTTTKETTFAFTLRGEPDGD